MPKHYSMGGRVPAAPPSGGSPGPMPQSLRERFGALRNLPPFVRLVWQTNPTLTLAQCALRLLRALLLVVTLYVGKLIIDEVVALTQTAGAPQGVGDWLHQGLLDRILWLLALEFGLAVLSDVLGRTVSYFDSLLGEQIGNATSLRVMEHAATLDLEDFEDSELQDRLERARRQAAGRMTLIGQLLAQAQDVVTIVTFAAGLIVYAPWLIVLLAIALVPAFIGEAHFNALSYALNYTRTPERREIDYVRQTGASAETAKEVKIFGLNAFLIDRYRALAGSFYEANRRLSRQRATVGSVLTAIGTIAYYVAYAYIVWRTLHRDFTIGDLTFLAGSFRRLRTLLESLLMGFRRSPGRRSISTTCSRSSRSSRRSCLRPTRDRSRRRSARASSSRMSDFAIREPSAGRCAI
jgi:ATP-binding cassette subfamily B protein